MKIEKGSKWLCNEDVVMCPNNEKAYTQGETYTSERDGCLTNNKGNKAHYWTNKQEIKRIFTPVVEKKGQKFNEGKLHYHTVFFKQFPNALKEVVKRSEAGHQKYIKTDANWDNFKHVENAQQEYLEAAVRHMADEGVDQDLIEYGETLHEAAVIWNLLASLELKLSNK